MRPKFDRPTPFRTELTSRIQAYFDRTGLCPRDLPRMYVKAAIIALWFGASYVFLVFGASTWWQAASAIVSLAMAAAAVGFNVQHDAAHGAFSESARVNRWLARTLDLLGGSSYVWRWKHNVLHHTYPNITGADDDVAVGPLARLTPDQPWYAFHRVQHIYMWLLYALIPFKWQLVDDFRTMARSRIGPHPIPRPDRWELGIFVLGKLAFVVWVFGVPLSLHPWPLVLFGYLATAMTLGLILGVTFQLAHCVDAVAFPALAGPHAQLSSDWAAHQVATTADFACHRRWLTWFIGGLNFQIEHHLFPRICHLHYPALAPLIEATCREFRVPYHVHRRLRHALASHYRWLRWLGTGAGRSRSSI